MPTTLPHPAAAPTSSTGTPFGAAASAEGAPLPVDANFLDDDTPTTFLSRHLPALHRRLHRRIDHGDIIVVLFFGIGIGAFGSAWYTRNHIIPAVTTPYVQRMMRESAVSVDLANLQSVVVEALRNPHFAPKAIITERGDTRYEYKADDPTILAIGLSGIWPDHLTRDNVATASTALWSYPSITMDATRHLTVTFPRLDPAVCIRVATNLPPLLTAFHKTSLAFQSGMTADATDEVPTATATAGCGAAPGPLAITVALPPAVSN